MGQIVAMRNRLVDSYWDVNLDIVWQTLQEDLPVLLRALDDVDTRHP
jgi:uncharacterized protein with HEPN domain